MKFDFLLSKKDDLENTGENPSRNGVDNTENEKKNHRILEKLHKRNPKHPVIGPVIWSAICIAHTVRYHWIAHAGPPYQLSLTLPVEPLI